MLPELSFAQMFEGERLAFVGVGGGSDCVQAAMLATLSGRSACVVSIRAHRTGSQSASGAIGEARTVANHGGEVCGGVIRITRYSTGSGRFLEAIPAELGFPTYLVIDSQDGTLPSRLRRALQDFGDVDAVYGIDTGGDSLHQASVSDKARATPDQDLASLRAIATLQLANAHSVIVAPGIDSPPYASTVLAAANARHVIPSEIERGTLLDLYKSVRMDGSDSQQFGKTSLAWQAALRGERGPVRLGLPDHLINDGRNPWNPTVTITDEMAGAYVMTVDDHLLALGSTERLF